MEKCRIIYLIAALGLLQVAAADSTWTGAGDECLDLGGDAYIEGNVFMHNGKDAYNISSGQANVISTGDDNFDAVITCVGNIFYDIEYVIDLKNDTFLYFYNNIKRGLTHRKSQLIRA